VFFWILRIRGKPGNQTRRRDEKTQKKADAEGIRNRRDTRPANNPPGKAETSN